MKIKLLLFFLLLLGFIFKLSAQEVIIGKVSTESGTEIEGATVFNVRTEQKSYTDRDGNYFIAAVPTDEIRFILNGFERISQKISAENYTKPLNIVLKKKEIEIEEVIVGFRPTGNLKKDSRALDEAPKVVALNSSIRSSMREPLINTLPQNSMPSSFAPRNLNTGNVNLFKVAEALAGLVQKASGSQKTTPNYYETQEFLTKVKTVIGWENFAKYGFNEEEYDRFLLYANNVFQLAKNHRNNFNKTEIEFKLNKALKEYLETRKPISS